jgi:hypothetical protein
MTSPVPGTQPRETGPIGRTLTPARQARLVDDDLCICIYPGSYDDWRGTRAQLQATGLIPSSIEWPSGPMCVRWRSDGFFFWLQRWRPDRSLRPTIRGMKPDCWQLRRIKPHPRYNFLAAARERELIDELLMLRFIFTQAGGTLWGKYIKALRDVRFQAFKVKLMPAVKRPGRKRVVR